MHLVIDLNDDRLVIAEISDFYPGVHGQRVTGRRETVLAKNLIGKSFSALELIGVIAGNPDLNLDRLLVLGICDGRQKKTNKQSSYQEIGFCAKYLSLKLLSSP